MKYISTRNNSEPVSAAMAIVQGMVPGGGLFVPELIPVLTRKILSGYCPVDFRKIFNRLYLCGY